MNQPEPGAQIHHTDPFATPEEQRSPVRRLRGRLAAPVTLWTAYRDPGVAAGSGVGTAVGVEGALGPAGAARPAGLTVSSVLVADGEPGRLLGLVDEESELWAAISAAGRFAVVPLGPADRQLADRFAGLLPAPGGLFAAGGWTPTPYGPVPAGAGDWAGCRLDATREYGWALLVEATIERIELGPGALPLLHHRGRYHSISGPATANDQPNG